MRPKNRSRPSASDELINREREAGVKYAAEKKDSTHRKIHITGFADDGAATCFT